MDVGHQVMGERAGTRSGAWTGLRQLLGLWRVFLLTELVWLIISVVVLRFALASVVIVGVLAGVTVTLGASGQFLIAAIKASLPLGRRLARYVLAAAVALPVFLRPADLGEIIACSLKGFGPQARTVTVDFPPNLPLVMTDPPIMERVIVNLTGNALRYSPAGSPLLLTAGACGNRVELRFVDHGPGIPEAERDRAFMPFQRLGDTSRTTGVSLGLTVSRGLTEAMGGTLKPEETPGGGLTMAISLPAVPSPSQVPSAWPGKRSIFTERAVARALAQELSPS